MLSDLPGNSVSERHKCFVSSEIFNQSTIGMAKLVGVVRSMEEHNANANVKVYMHSLYR